LPAASGSSERDGLTVPPRIYIADLAAYTAGKLRGQWYDLSAYQDAEALHADIAAFLAKTGAEEWAIHDGLPSIREYESLETVFALSQAVNEYGYGPVKAFVSLVPRWDAEQFEEAFLGAYDSVEDYAYELIEDCYGDMLKAMGHLSGYFDYEAFARDLELSGDVSAVPVDGCRSVYLFRAS
jgi:antirestriction protein